MASIFRALEQFTLDQDGGGRGGFADQPPETLQATIKVFVINTPDPNLRYRMMCFCLRLVVSNSARTGQRHGALMTLLSLPTAVMQNHFRTAERSPDCQIERIEVDGFEPGTYRIRPNARTPLTVGEVVALEEMADDIPEALANNTPFIDANTEMEDCDETEKFLEAIYSTLIQVWIMVCKSMTNFDQPTGSDERRVAKYQQQGRLNQHYLLQGEVRRRIQVAIRESLPIRQFLVNELQIASNQGPITGKYYAMVADIGKYIMNAGMGGFFMTIRFALGQKWPPLALAAFSGEIVKIKSLMLQYRRLGERAKYMALLEMSEMMDFAAANFPLLYSYAMGIGSVQDPQMRGYAFGRPYLNAAFYQLGVETANQQQGSVDKEMAEELGLTEADKRAMAATVARLTTGRGQQGGNIGVNAMARRGQAQPPRQQAIDNLIDEEEEDEEEEEEEEQNLDAEIERRFALRLAQEQERWGRRLAELEAERAQTRQGPGAAPQSGQHQNQTDNDQSEYNSNFAE
ncbi:nucleoprotein [Sosuga virus]|uniref:Nucleocapsid n=12 Tax=Sosuga virus TaxID=1452514 RepID=W5SB57_9MONO|nr:nucleoprotein [Sosuga virus]AHH02035.1 nucleoprotein [Sosuga virus]AVT50846.1 NP [Expression vector pSOSV_FL-vc]AVT50852.1 NP [Expression vector pSOSV/ZsG-FL]